MNLCVYETFSSIQGESSYAGIPCFFIRLAGCPLRCAWCDTRKAQDPAAGRLRTVEDLIREADEAARPLVEVTGGEPLAQEHTADLCEGLLRAGHTVLIETNGAESVSRLPEGVVRILDFKTPSSGMERAMLPENFRTLRPCDEVKFVIADENDYVFAKRILTEYRLPSQIRNILFSPAFGLADGRKLCEWILRDRLPVRINLQFHKIIWGPACEGV